MKPLFFPLVLVASLGLCGCTTVRPGSVEAEVPVKVERTADGSLVLHRSDLDAYNYLVRLYGNERVPYGDPRGSPIFAPEPAEGQGVTPRGDGTWLLDRSVVERYALLKWLQRIGARPVER